MFLFCLRQIRQMNPGCLHINVLETAIENFDLMFSNSPTQEDHLSEGVYVDGKFFFWLNPFSTY